MNNRYFLNEQDCQNASRNDLRGHIKEVIAPFQNQIEDRQIKTNIIMHTSVPDTIKIQSKMYKEILFNLVYNAVKYNKMQGEVNIKISYK